MICFKTTKEEAKLILKIVKRASILLRQQGFDNPDLMALDMDITACHANGNPLKLTDLLTADDFNFTHDVFGISRHINRKTGQLEDCFSPRFSA